MYFWIEGTQLSITQSGQYSLGSDINYISAGNDSIIRISANNVVLDLNNNNIQQAGGPGTVHGIEIVSGYSNIIIKNASIKNISGSAFLINPNCNNITIDTFQTLSVNRGISIANVSGSSISNCRIKNGVLRFITDSAIFVGPQARNISIDTLLIDSCSTTTNTILFAGTTIARCSSNSINNVLMTNCGSGIQLLNTDNSMIKNCRILNSSSSVDFDGFKIQGITGILSTGNIIKNCTVESVTSSGVNFGFNFQDTLGGVVSNCFVTDLLSTTTTVVGYNMSSNIVDGVGSLILRNCDANSLNVLSSQVLFGCLINKGRAVVVKDSAWTTLVGKNNNANRSGAIIANSSSFVTIKNSKSENTSFSGYTIYNGISCIVSHCTSIDSYNTSGNSYVSTAFLGFGSSNTLFDYCISCSQSAQNTSGAFYCYGDVSSMFSDCISNGTSNSGFNININSGENCFVQNCTATNAGVYGFQTLANPVVYYNNIATNCGTAGFFQTNPIGTSRYFLNQATNNGTNYSGPIPNQRSQNQRKQQGANLSI